MMQTWYVYILRCADKTLYTGITTEPERRMREHNHEKQAAKYTRARRPVELVYLESAPDRSTASQREHAIRQFSRAQKEKLILSSPCDVTACL